LCLKCRGNDIKTDGGKQDERGREIEAWQGMKELNIGWRERSEAKRDTMGIRRVWRTYHMIVMKKYGES
jgi:hypothetical protein